MTATITQLKPPTTARKPRRRHGMGAAGLAALIKAQGSACAICRVPFADEPGKRGAVDHDHKHCPGKQGCRECVRGVLCVACNNLLRCAKDEPAILRSAIDYLTAIPMPFPRPDDE